MCIICYYNAVFVPENAKEKWLPYLMQQLLIYTTCNRNSYCSWYKGTGSVWSKTESEREREREGETFFLSS